MGLYAVLGMIFGMVVGMTLIGGFVGWLIWLFAKTPQPAADIIGIILVALASGYTNSASFGQSPLFTTVAYLFAGLFALAILQSWHHRDEEGTEMVTPSAKTAPTSVTERLGYFLYWAAIAIAVVPATLGLIGAIWGQGDTRWIPIALAWAATLVIVLIGRGLKYVLSGVSVMPQIDLSPNDYRKQDHKTGRWHLPDDPKLCRNMFFVAVAALTWIFFNRGGVMDPTTFLLVGLFAFAGGIMFATWLRNVY